MKHLLWVAVATLAACSPAASPAAVAPVEPNVKLSGGGICHERNTAGYNQTQKARPFESIEACLKAGGRVPRNVPAPAKDRSADVDKALFDTDNVSIVKKSRTGICHDASSGSFSVIIHFRAYRTMQDCLDSGGRPRGASTDAAGSA